MKFLLDTCLISESIRPRPQAAVLEWLGSQDEGDLHLCSLTLGELEKAIERLDRGARRSRLELWMRELAARFEPRLISIDGAVAIHWGHLVAQLEVRGLTLPVVDGLIASCALVHGMVLVTRNVADFVETGVELFNPWDLASR